MTLRRVLTIPLLVLLLTSGWAAALADPKTVSPPSPSTGSGRFLVHLKVPNSPEGSLPRGEGVVRQQQAIGVAKDTVRRALAGRSYRVVREYQWVPFMAIEGGPEVRTALNPMVATIYPDRLFRLSLNESVPLVRADQAWAQGFDGTGSVMAVLDTGVDKQHPFLAGKVINEACYSANGSCPNGADTQLGPGAGVPCTFASGACRHGTHVAGIAAGAGATFSGVARGGQVMAIQVFSKFTGTDCDGAGESPCALAYTSNLIAAMEHVYEFREQYRIAAVNMSLGGAVYSSSTQCDADNSPTKAIIDILRSVGIATVVSAGNDGATNGITEPACISSAISVGSTTKTDAISSFSNSAEILSLLAPGSSIHSSVPGGGFALFSGTSMASPHVAGAWAVAKQKSPQASVAAVLDALVTTGVPRMDSRNGITKRRIDVAGAVALIPSQSVTTFTLSVSRSGAGLVTSDLPGIACGNDCTEAFPSDAVVTLSATPDPGYTFTGWGGDPDCTDGSVRMTGNKVCTATFLDVTQPTGSVTINRNADATISTAVTLNMTASDAVGVSGYYLSLNPSPPSPSVAGWVPVTLTQSYNATLPFTLTAGEGAKTVYVWYKDSAGNVSAPASDSIILQAPFASGAVPSIVLEQIATGLAFPVAITHARDSSGRLFIALQQGKIVIYDGTRILPTAFLDLSTLVTCCGERGLLGVAFHPNYATNGFFFVNYTNTAGNTVIARYKVSANQNIADVSSARTVLTIAQPPFTNHKGGQLQFGPDGYLYIAMGDGGSGGDPDNRAQNLADLLGKILRIDVDVDVNAVPLYAIPPGNPFVATPDAKREIWAWGLRNPWRFSFDRLTGDLFIGDVGQSAREEVNLQPVTSAGGQNYGWRLMEGTACFNPTSGCNNGTLVLPILEYLHGAGDCSVTGGYRYRGAQIPALTGTYLYADYCSGKIWGATPNGQLWTSTLLLDLPFTVSTFGEDQGGELYVAQHAANGAIHRIKNATPPSLTINGSSSPVTVSAGASVTLGIQNSPGTANDCVTLDLASQVNNFAHLGFAWVPGSSATLSFIIPSTPGVYAFRLWQNCSTPLAISSTITVPSSSIPLLTVNGSSAPITVAAGAGVILGVQNGPGTANDCVTLDLASLVNNSAHLGFAWVPGSTATLSFIIPSAPGVYAFRFWQNCTTQLAISSTITVPSSSIPLLTVNGSSAPITVAAGAGVTLVVQNGPGTANDCVTLDLASLVNNSAHLGFAWVLGSTATLSFVIPSTPGVYAFRFWQNCNTLLALSPTVTVIQ